tara:strand:- start:1209 stop:1475 length:267 start_codon:yes stop_codon:yes gene_type:complete
MATYSTDVSDSDHKAFEYVANTPQDWVENAVQARIQLAKTDILQRLQQHCNANDIAMAVGESAQIDQAYDLGVIQTAAQRNEEALAEE